LLSTVRTSRLKAQYQQALQLAQHAKAPEAVLVAKLNLSRVAMAEGRSSSMVRAISQEADRQGLKYLALASSVELGAAMVNSKDYAPARQDLDQSLNTSEKLGTRLQTATIHYQLAILMKHTGDASGAAGQYRQVATLLDEIKKEQGAEHILERADLKTLYNESSLGAGQTNPG
jgi:eukaryotic-like serine/threonine-protein kinase